MILLFDNIQLLQILMFHNITICNLLTHVNIEYAICFKCAAIVNVKHVFGDYLRKMLDDERFFVR